MNQYHYELRHLSDILRRAKTGGYSCGDCPECDDLYNEFDKIVGKIKKDALQEKRA